MKSQVSCWILEEYVRSSELIGLLVFAPHYSAVKILFNNCAEYRDSLGNHFNQLLTLLIERSWCNRMGSMYKEAKSPFDNHTLLLPKEKMRSWYEGRLTAFVLQRIPSDIQPWKIPNHADIPHEVSPFISDFRPDLSLLLAGYSWLMNTMSMQDVVKRTELIEFLSDALTYILNRLTKHINKRDRSHPSGNEEIILNKISIVIQCMTAEEHPEQFWHPIFNVGENAFGYLSYFLQRFHFNCLNQKNIPPEYITLRGMMYDYAVQKKTLVNNEQVWLSLFGLHWSILPSWEKRHQSIIRSYEVLFRNWFDFIPPGSDCIVSFIRWLETPAAEPLLLEAIMWLENKIGNDKSLRFFDNESNSDRLAVFLTYSWNNYSSKIRNNTAPCTSFKILLNLLIGKQNSIALDLVGNIGRF